MTIDRRGNQGWWDVFWCWFWHSKRFWTEGQIKGSCSLPSQELSRDVSVWYCTVCIGYRYKED